MLTPNNPYANALDGLELADPVSAFFDFCRERENIRIRRQKKNLDRGLMIRFLGKEGF